MSTEREEFSLYCIIEGQTFTRPLYKVSFPAFKGPAARDCYTFFIKPTPIALGLNLKLTISGNSD
jgi:hypothetical protein